MKGTNTAKILAMGIAIVTVLGVLPLVMAADEWVNSTVSVSITDNNYVKAPNDWTFIPGDPIEITIRGTQPIPPAPPDMEDIFDIIIYDDVWPPPAFANKVGHFNDVVLDPNGEAVRTYEGDMTKSLADGCYRVYVGPEDWYETNGFDGPDSEWTSIQFCILLYVVEAATDRRGYVPGDDVTVFYSVVSIKDGSLITEDAYANSNFNGEWAVESQDGKTSFGPTTFDDPSGTFEFQVFPQGSAHPDFYRIDIYFNGTYGSVREGQRTLRGNWFMFTDFYVDTLDLAVSTDRADYQLGSTVIVTVDSMVDQPNSAEPDVKVEIEILEGTGVTADKITGYGGTFHSDASGDVVYAFTAVDNPFEEDQIYTVRVNVSKHLKAAERETTFNIVAGGRVISANMVFDKDVYTSGDTVRIDVQTAVPEGASAVTSYSYRVSVGTQTMWAEVKSSNLFDYNIPDNFEGPLIFRVDVYNADGDSGMDTETKMVRHVVLLINAEPQQYNPGQTITANYQLISNRLDAEEERTFFYVATDANNRIVLEGQVQTSAKTGSFQYTVPDVASSYYIFEIQANVVLKVGDYDYRVWTSARDACTLISGYDLEISVDNPAYSPGDRVTIHYEITTKGDQGLPDKFVFSYGMSNGEWFTWQSSSPSGDIYYTIPSGVNEGDVEFSVYALDGDGGFVGRADEMLRIQESPNPFEFVRLGDIPLISIILLILVILLIIIMLFRRPGAAPAPEAEPELGPPEEEALPEEVAEGEEVSPLSINCKSCGAAIEITTSKRPIEVMCPSCGETEMVE